VTRLTNPRPGSIGTVSGSVNRRFLSDLGVRRISPYPAAVLGRTRVPSQGGGTVPDEGRAVVTVGLGAGVGVTVGVTVAGKLAGELAGEAVGGVAEGAPEQPASTSSAAAPATYAATIDLTSPP